MNAPFRAATALSSLFASLVVLCACSGSSSSGDGDGGTVAKGTQTAPDNSTTPTTTQPTGKTCGAADDCAYWYCQCNDGAVVNSRLCSQSTCQGPKAHCPSACTTFSHGGWSGSAGGGDAPSTSSGADSGTTSPGACSDKSQCATFSCGCTDGSRITGQDCLSNACATAVSGCESACSDNGRGDWDGT
jgi:hypothetical protein